MRMLWKKSWDLRIRYLKKTVNQRQISTDQSEIAVLQLFPTWTSMWGLFWISMQRMWTEAQHSSLSWEKIFCKQNQTLGHSRLQQNIRQMTKNYWSSKSICLHSTWDQWRNISRLRSTGFSVREQLDSGTVTYTQTEANNKDLSKWRN